MISKKKINQLEEIISYKFKDKKLLEIKKSITKPIFHEVDAYGNNPDRDHGSDQVSITVFRKR